MLASNRGRTKRTIVNTPVENVKFFPVTSIAPTSPWNNLLTLACSQDDPGDHNELESCVVVLKEVDDAVKPEGDEAPAEAGAKNHPLGAKPVAQVAA